MDGSTSYAQSVHCHSQVCMRSKQALLIIYINLQQSESRRQTVGYICYYKFTSKVISIKTV